MKFIKCPRTTCNNAATINPLYGIIPCDTCQAKSAKEKRLNNPIQYINIAKAERIINQRSKHEKDILQPYDAHDNPNPEFVKAYPEKRDQYFTKEQLRKL